MAGLGETLRGLSRGPAATSHAGSRLSPTKVFGSNPGGLVMLSYVPPGLERGAPLVVLLHGCTQDAEVHAAAGGWLSLADRHGFAILAPQQTAANNPNRCFNWFEPKDIARGSGEAASIHGMIRHMLSEHGLDPARVFVSGLSAGGAMAAVMLAAYPEMFAGGAIVAGLPYGVAGSVQGALAAMRGGGSRPIQELVDRVREAAPKPARYPRVCIWHGDADHTVNVAAGDDLARQWSGAHGLPLTPDVRERVDGRTRARWLSADGDVLVEQHTLHGLGHGVPLATHGNDGMGFAAPFMLEAGVASALVTARFWGLAPEGSTGMGASPPFDQGVSDGATAEGLAAGILAATAPHVPRAVQDVIARALGAAGLIR